MSLTYRIPAPMRRARGMRIKQGTRVKFNGEEYPVWAAEVSGTLAGVQQLPKEVLGPLIASADPHQFIFGAEDFNPYTGTLPPIEGDELIWHNLRYKISHVTYGDRYPDTEKIFAYAYREVI